MLVDEFKFYYFKRVNKTKLHNEFNYKTFFLALYELVLWKNYLYIVVL